MTTDLPAQCRRKRRCPGYTGGFAGQDVGRLRIAALEFQAGQRGESVAVDIEPEIFALEEQRPVRPRRFGTIAREMILEPVENTQREAGPDGRTEIRGRRWS